MRKTISLFLLVLMLISIMPAAGFGDISSGILVADVNILPDTYYIASGTTLATTTDDKAELWYTHEDNILHLKDFKIDLNKEVSYGISLTEPKVLNISLSGKNEILNAYSAGIFTNDGKNFYDLIINGEDSNSSLDLSGTPVGIMCSSLVLNNVMM